MKNETKRIELLKKIKEDNNTIKVKDVADIFASTLNLLSEKTNTFKNVIKKLTEEEWIRFQHSLINSFLSSLYASASKDDKELKERINYINDVNSDIAVGIAIGGDYHGK